MLRPKHKPETNLCEIIDQLGGYHPITSGNTEISVTGISMNSKVVQPGDLYAAVAGSQHHGADYIDQAIAAGAVAVLTDAVGIRRVPDQYAAIVVDDVRGALADAAALIYGNTNSQHPKVYGVTGTNGKTTTTYFLEALLAAVGKTTGLIGTIETRIAGQSVPSQFTTPEAPALHSLIARMREANVSAAAMEVSSHAMAYKRTFGLRYAVAGFTNLTQDHLDLHGSMAEYFAAKAMLFNDEHSVQRVVTLNGGAEPVWGQQLADQVPNAVTLDLGPAAGAPSSVQDPTWKIQSIHQTGLGHQFTLEHESGYTVTTRVGMPGKFNIANAALAATMVFTGHDRAEWDTITAALQNTEKSPFDSSVPGRMEVIADQPTVIVDFAHNPDGLTQALKAVNHASAQRYDTGRTIIIFGATGQRDTAKRPLMGRIAAQHADIVIVTDDDPHGEDPATVRKAVVDGARAYAASCTNGPEVIEIAPRAAALDQAISLARPQDTILAAGRGHETQQDFAGEVIAIDDREVLRQSLVDHGFITHGCASTEDTD
ncbi:MAG TPA: UDP-N-acetylmuramoyl-L-alanyl-D-glutamate--2,6-diaminopimelate ligase [Candidatus Yaniella excrementigallinarum]|nr:UDP-N-acetylmuramoyl-L-alanyl-D-glutamate--2,6-diaminopimelate ligase [Candidatus Yaniella excrementigallinarum]